MKCFVWRVPLPEDIFSDGTSKFEFVRDELLNKKILRQGWGVEDLRKGEDAYVKRQRSKGNTDAKEAKKTFDMLTRMLNIEVGNLIVIPRLSLRNNQNTSGKYFTVVVCTKVYDFYFPFISDWDFGHFVEVDWNKDKDVTYDYDVQSPNKDVKYISEQLKAYQSPINNVRDINFTTATLNLS